MKHPITKKAIEQHLRTKGISVTVCDELPSTNTTLKQLAEQGAPEGTVLFARHQTHGKGRLGRSFFSPQDSGIYMSILLRPQLAAKDALLITTCAAVATAQAIEAHTKTSCTIKWVNDLFCGDRKVCGILTEASLDAKNLRYAVLGIGINLFLPDGGFPAELQTIAGTVSAVQTDDLNARIAAAIIDRFFSEYPYLTERRFLAEYRRRCFLLGKPVNVCKAGRPSQSAVALSVEDDLGLRVRYADGSEETLSTGEVSIKIHP